MKQHVILSYKSGDYEGEMTGLVILSPSKDGAVGPAQYFIRLGFVCYEWPVDVTFFFLSKNKVTKEKSRDLVIFCES